MCPRTVRATVLTAHPRMHFPRTTSIALERISTHVRDLHPAEMYPTHPSGGEVSSAETWRLAKVQENDKDRHTSERWRAESKKVTNRKARDPCPNRLTTDTTTITPRSTSKGKSAKVQSHVSRSQKAVQSKKNKSKKRERNSKKKRLTVSSREESPGVR